MRISHHISELLFRYDCVTVPNLGGFMAEKISANIDKNTGEFTPPSKRISFNSQLKNNDGILANHISEIERISYEDALLKINKQVNCALKDLENNCLIEFSGIGSLAKSKNGKFIFEPTKKENYLKESFGLTTIISPSINRENEVIPLRFNSNKSYSYTKYAAIAIVFISLAYFFGANFYLDYIDHQNFNAQKEANNIIDNKIQKATFIISTELPTITIDVAKQIGKYHIVAGAFRVKKNSERKLRELKRLGFNARAIGQNSYGLYQVVFESHLTRKEAENALIKIKNSQDSTAWLLFKKTI